MRIELPPASWADAAHRADDDAHTLTLIAQADPVWTVGHAFAEPGSTLRTQVSAQAPATMTLTF